MVVLVLTLDPQRAGEFCVERHFVSLFVFARCVEDNLELEADFVLCLRVSGAEVAAVDPVVDKRRRSASPRFPRAEAS